MKRYTAYPCVLSDITSAICFILLTPFRIILNCSLLVANSVCVSPGTSS